MSFAVDQVIFLVATKNKRDLGFLDVLLDLHPAEYSKRVILNATGDIPQTCVYPEGKEVCYTDYSMHYTVRHTSCVCLKQCMLRCVSGQELCVRFLLKALWPAGVSALESRAWLIEVCLCMAVCVYSLSPCKESVFLRTTYPSHVTKER
jgi:hypothetical protein